VNKLKLKINKQLTYHIDHNMRRSYILGKLNNLFYLYFIYLKIVFSNNLATVFGKELRYNVTHSIECP